MKPDFATAKHYVCAAQFWISQPQVETKAANDNSSDGNEDAYLSVALKHFAMHGLGAARDAREKAEKAFFAGDRTNYDHWIMVCRKLDRALAEKTSNGFQEKPQNGA